MVQVNEVTSLRECRFKVVIDLVGDLDATLATTLTEALARVADPEVLISCRHVEVANQAGLTAIGQALSDAAKRGCNVVVSPGSRKLRAVLAAARIPCAPPDAGEPAAGRRSVIIARNASTPNVPRAIRAAGSPAPRR